LKKENYEQDLPMGGFWNPFILPVGLTWGFGRKEPNFFKFLVGNWGLKGSFFQFGGIVGFGPKKFRSLGSLDLPFGGTLYFQV